ncbi:MAG: hypothetical protein MZU95_14605 [Desulfomicrobium escambiense]|nr:hypothetical protein [Desulfomicrobium escambiense]
MTHVGSTQVDARGRPDPQPGLRRHAARATCRPSSPNAARARRRSANRCAALVVAGLTSAARTGAGQSMRILGIETSCDETAAAVVEEVDDAARPWVVRSSVVASQVDDPPRVGRRRARTGLAPAHPGHLRRRRARDGRCGRHGEGPRRDRGDAGAGPRRIAAGGRVVREVAGGVRGTCPSCRCTTSRATSSRCSCSTVRCRCRRWCSSCPAATRASTTCARRASTAPSAGRGTTPPARPTTRSRNWSASGYPGGPVIDRLAKTGDDRALHFPVARMTHPDRNEPLKKGQWDFSFSGLKTAVLRHVRAQGDGWSPGPQELADLCASFQRSVVEALIDKTFAAARWYGVPQRRHRRRRVGQQPPARRCRGRRGAGPAFRSSCRALALSTDNAAMIAAAGLQALPRGRARRTSGLNAEASLAAGTSR